MVPARTIRSDQLNLFPYFFLIGQSKRLALSKFVLSGQESFRINSFVKSNMWALLPQGQSKFKKGQIIDCFFPNFSNKILD